MCLSATLIATDTIAPLTLIDRKANPTLFSVVFGEGVSNDAVSLLIMDVVLGFKDTRSGRRFFTAYRSTHSWNICFLSLRFLYDHH